MAIHFQTGDSVITSLVADLKAAILGSTDWSNPAGQRIVCTTTRGADMVVDLADAAAISSRLQLGVYRTAALADKVVRYVNWRVSGGATSDTVHWRVSSGKEYLYFDVEGPRVGEVNTSSAINGSQRQYFFLGDLLPYFASDTVPAVVLAAATAAGSSMVYYASVSRNQGNTSSWVQAKLLSLASPSTAFGSISGGTNFNSAQPVTTADSKTYMWPYIVVEEVDGLRGRLSSAFYCGSVGTYTTNDTAIPAIFSRRSYGGTTYILLNPVRNASLGLDVNPLGAVYNGSVTDSPIIAIPYS